MTSITIVQALAARARGCCQDSAFEVALSEFNMQFEISHKLFVHIYSFFLLAARQNIKAPQLL